MNFAVDFLVDFLGPFSLGNMGGQHPSHNVKTLCNFEIRIRPEMITSRDAENTCFKGSGTSCDVIIFGFFSQILESSGELTDPVAQAKNLQL